MSSSLRPFSDLGAALRLLRETVAGLTQVQVAERTGIAQNRLSRYESGRQHPDVPTLDRLLACYVRRGRGTARTCDQGGSRQDGGQDFGKRSRAHGDGEGALVQLGYLKPGPPE